MTKEPIIIDDIDVSECIYYADGKCTNSQMIQSNCKNVAVCYFKEYKRKEQECEELLKFNNSLVKEHKTIGNDLYKEIKDYRIKLKTKEEECEKKDKDVKFLLEKLDLANNRIQDCEIYWEKEKKNLKQQLDQLKAYIKDDLVPHAKLYKQALQEIKDILEQYLDYDKRIDKEADVDFYIWEMQKWLRENKYLKL